MRLSVVIPIYKVEAFLPKCVGRLDAEKDADQRFIKKYDYKYRMP